MERTSSSSAMSSTPPASLDASTTGAKDGASSRAPSAESQASFSSRLLLLWILPMVLRGWRKPLTDPDLPELLDEERGEYTSARLRRALERASAAFGATGPSGKKPRLSRTARAVFSNHKMLLLVTGLLKVLDIALAAGQPVCINFLLKFLSGDEPRSRGYLLSLALFALPLLKSLVENHYFLKTMRAGMRVRSSLQGILYEKSLNMSPAARASSTTGEVVNLMQLDAQRACEFFQFVHTLWAAPVQVVVTVTLLFFYIGPSAIIGLVVTALTIPLQGKLMTISIGLRRKGVAITDQRVKIMNEILQGIKAVKFYAWERPFAELVMATRDEEVKNFGKTVIVRSAFVTVMMVIPTIIAVVTFTFFAGVFKQDLKPDRVFTGIALLNQLRTPVMMLPMVATSAIDAKLAVKRIERFLFLEDIDNYNGRPDPFVDGSGPSALVRKAAVRDKVDIDEVEEAIGKRQVGNVEPSICIRNGEFGWGRPTEVLLSRERKKSPGLLGKCFGKGRKKYGDSASAAPDDCNAAQDSELQEVSLTGDAAQDSVNSPDAGKAFLRNVTLEIKNEELVGIVGRVGSGKTSLVNAILGEMRKVHGEVSIVGSIAYVAQTAWIFNDTLRNNVLFGKPFDQKLYDRAIDVSALRPDIEILTSGDMTAIGEKGINLSGGQKQRVSMARAVYANADVYIFDDPLSALDSHVGQSVFENCISNQGVLRKKLRLFVTNQLQTLPDCNRVAFMQEGTLNDCGPYESLMLNPDFRQLVTEVEQSTEEPAADDFGTGDPAGASGGDGPTDSLNRSLGDVLQSVDGVELSKEEIEAAKSAQSQDKPSTDSEEKKRDDGKVLIKDEERLTGNVLLRAYYRYAVACGGVSQFSFILALFAVSVTMQVLSTWWLAYWSQNSFSPTGKDLTNTRSLGFYLGIYFGLSVAYAVMTFGRSVWFLTSALKASTGLHNSMLKSVLRAPMSFFDQTPIGRVISRFSRDVNAVDQLLPQAFSQMLSTVLNLLASYVYIAVIIPVFLSVAIPTTFLYYALQRFYNRTSIELKRLDSISKSPIYAGFSETLGGLSTIRAYHKQLQFRTENMEKIDVNQRAYFSTIASNRWFSLYLEAFGSVLVFATALFSVLARGNGQSPAEIGLALTYALQVTGILGFTIRSITELELQMNSVERMDYYGTRLDQEAPATLPDNDILEGGKVVWPSAGVIRINDVQMRYREGLDLVLKGISLTVGSGEKVGIVGRTGSGKSSLMLVLLRLVEVAGGSITIDGVNVAEVGLDDVRSNITIIPQDPVLFSGTVRFNLDPFGVYSEAELWDALAKSHLKTFVQQFEGGLDARVTEYGENISAGQKQLICLTRALLRKSKVLIMDEASSSLDYETDRLLQQSIQENMKEATVLTIAHRLWTLTKCDKILVMRDGLASEFDTPEALLDKEDSELRFLVNAMGEESATKFREMVNEHAALVGRM